MAALPEALSLAPADWWHRCAVRTTSSPGRSRPGIVAATTSYVAGTIRARTRAWSVIRSAAASRDRISWDCRAESMNANVFRIWYGDRWPQRTRSRSSPDQAVRWFG